MSKFKLFLYTILIILEVIFTSSIAQARPAPIHYVDVTVVNQCDIPIQFYIDNNWGSAYMGYHDVQAAGSYELDKDGQKRMRDRLSYIFSASNDAEFYTISYQGANCIIDYPMIKDYWSLKVSISGCGKVPHCTIN